METRIAGYIIRKTASPAGTWQMVIPSTGEVVRTYTDYERATQDAKRYARMTAGLSQ